MSNTKRQLNLCSFYDHPGVARHLEKMAAEGWLLERISTGSGIWRYRKAEPQTLRYAVTYFPAASDFDAAPGQDQQAFMDLCAEAGWQFVTQSAQMQIFCNASADAVPLDTEPSVQVENIHRAMKANFLIAQCLFLALALLNFGVLAFSFHRDPLDYFTSAGMLFSTACWVLISVQAAVELATYFRWRSRARAAAEEGVFLPTRGSRYLAVTVLAVLAVLVAGYLTTLEGGYVKYFLLYVAVVFACIAAGNLLKAGLKRRGTETSLNRTVTILFAVVLTLAAVTALNYFALSHRGFNTRDGEAVEYQWMGRTMTLERDPLPLTVADLTAFGNENYSLERHRSVSPLISQVEYLQVFRYDMEPPAGQPDRLVYTVWTSRFPALLDLAVSQCMEEAVRYVAPEECSAYGFRETDPAPWGAEEAWQYYADSAAENAWLLRYDGRVVRIRFDWTPTAAQMSAVAEKLTA